MLVLVTNREDLTADWLIIELERRGIPFLRLSTEDYPMSIEVELTGDGVARLHVGETLLDAKEIGAVWWRRPRAPTIDMPRDPRQAEWAVREALVAWEGFWHALDAHWVNNPACNQRADCKPLQLREARRHGLTVPPTVITNNPDIARAFQAHHAPLVSKPLGEGVVPSMQGDRLLYTQKLDPKTVAAGDLGPEPYLLQAFVDKVADIRVTIIGENVFACRIESQLTAATAIDWRRGDVDKTPHTPVELDPDLVAKLRSLTAGLGLRFAAVDLALDRDGRHVFFEVNPNGQWAWIEQLTGLPLRAALADELGAR